MMRWGLIQWRYREVLLVDDLFMLSEAQRLATTMKMKPNKAFTLAI
jgi:hypothetical protein